MLRSHINEELQDSVISLDINIENLKANHKPTKRIQASMLALPIVNNSLDYEVMNFCLHYTQYKTKEGNFEREKARRCDADRRP